MAGGIWIKQDKVRPGAYTNFKTNSLADAGLDLTGAVIVPIALDWGVVGEFVKVTPSSDFKALFGKPLNQIVPIREAFKGSSQVTVFNVNGEGVKATAVSTTFTATAVHGGTGGNNISVKFTLGLNESVVKTYLDGVEVDSQTAAIATDLAANDYVVFSGDFPVADATLTLATGTTVPATNGSYDAIVAGLDTQEFKTIALGTEEADLKALFALKVKELREMAGKNVTFVTNGYAIADSEAVVSVVNGVTLEGNEVLTAKDAVYFYGGAYASAGVDSLTYVAYPGAIDCERKTNDEIIQALKDGHIIYTFNNGLVVIEQDINTFKSFTVEKNQDFRKNKIVRTQDAISDATSFVFSTKFIGKNINNGNGRNLFKAALIKDVYDPLAGVEAIEYTSEEIIVEQGIEKDAVTTNSYVTIQDAMEKLYTTVNCK
ncbi:phage tail sheath C-terminal domain-containing protein [Sporosarcina sp. FSL K6-2383]|uniref:phage tail sheath C-terminal domain-containing protein n=1 Tax=Sporosarcina sp. FSL K6-2383 TaxID=2921556 RepID=UPI003159A9F8